MDRNILELATHHGTPIYIYHKEGIHQQIVSLRHAFRQVNAKIHYACKANSNVDILTYLYGLGVGVDTVSLEEVALVQAIGFKPMDILFTPSFPSVEDLYKAIDLGLKVHINSMEYIPYLQKIAKPINIGIRINPEIEVELNKKTATSHKESKFGIPISDIDALISQCESTNVTIVGLHIHLGSGVSDWIDYISAIDMLFDLVERIPSISYIDIGGGYKIKFKPTDMELDIVSLADYITSKVRAVQGDIDIILEPGKYIVSQAGVFVAKVEMVKQGVNTQFVGLNSGFNHLFRPMYYDAYHEIVNLSNPDGERRPYDVVGYLCEEDTFAYKRMLPEVSRGDYLMFENAGAYGYSMSSNYNLRKKPKELLV